MKRKFLLCEMCGNLVEVVNDRGVIPVCCGASMKELVANTTDATVEKHVPVINVADGVATITVGETLHPMSEEHYIAWIYLETNLGVKRANLTPGEEPIAKFAMLEDEVVKGAYAYCNLHGLWMSEN